MSDPVDEDLRDGRLLAKLMREVGGLVGLVLVTRETDKGPKGHFIMCGSDGVSEQQVAMFFRMAADEMEGKKQPDDWHPGIGGATDA